MKKLFLLLTACALLVACSPEIGGEKWCKNLEEKPKGDWTATELKDYTKHCVF